MSTLEISGRHSAVARRRRGAGRRGVTVRLTELIVIFSVLAIVAGVMLHIGTGAANSATVVACRESVSNLETVVQVYESQHDGAVPTVSDLTSGASPYITSLPASAAFSLSISGGTVLVTTPASVKPVAASEVSACAGANTAT